MDNIRRKDYVRQLNQQLIDKAGQPIQFSKEESEVLRLIGMKPLTPKQKREAVKKSLIEAWSRR